MSYLSQSHLVWKYDLSRSTGARICKYMLQTKKYQKGVRVINNQRRYDEELFIQASNERSRTWGL